MLIRRPKKSGAKHFISMDSSVITDLPIERRKALQAVLLRGCSDCCKMKNPAQALGFLCKERSALTESCN